jgi:hypothetical protein
MEESCGITDVGCWLEWLSHEAGQKVRELYYSLLQSLVDLFHMIPVPDFMAEPMSFSLPESIVFWLGLFQVATGCAMVVSAYLARFILRRIPLIG